MTANENIFWGSLSPCGGGGPCLSDPGLTGDASYHEASCTLRGGFGPFVDVLLASGAWMRYDARRAAGDARDEVLRLERVLAR